MYTKYVECYLESYRPEIEELAKRLDVSPDDTTFVNQIAVASTLFKPHDYEFNRYASTFVSEIRNERFILCDEMMEKIGRPGTCVEDPFVTFYPAKYGDQDLFAYDSNMDHSEALTLIVEGFNNLIRNQKYPNNEVKKNLWNNMPIKIVLNPRGYDMDSTYVGQVVARIYFKLISCSCFYSSKHGAYPNSDKSGWSSNMFCLNGKTYSLAAMEKAYPAFSWKTTMLAVKGDKANKVAPIIPANSIIIEGPYQFMGNNVKND